MAALPSSGPLSINDIAGVMGGSAPHSLSEYYRGGGLVPSTRLVETRDPTSGYYYTDPFGGGPFFFWYEDSGNAGFYWNGSQTTFSAGPTSYTVGSITYYRGPYVQTIFSGLYYQIYRVTSTTTNINSGVPTSGTISISNFYGAEKP